MNEVSADTVMFFEPSMGKPIAVVNPANEFLSQIQSPYDSITRYIWNAVPLKREGDDFETVTVSFRENRNYSRMVRLKNLELLIKFLLEMVNFLG